MAGHWRKFDAGFFSLELPPEWVMQEPGSGTILVRDKRGEVALRMIAVSKPAGSGKLALPVRATTAREAQYELQKWIAAQKQVAIRHEPRAVPNGHHTTATTEGVERAKAGVPWYRRFLRRGPVLLWRFWAVLNPHLLVLASCQGKPEILEKYRPVIDRIVASMQLAERDILLGRHFTDRVVSLARSYFPELTVAIIDDGHLRCGSQPVSLTPLQRRYLSAPDDLPTHVKSFFAEVQGDLPAAEVGHSWSSARRRILPRFMATSEVATSDLMHEPWINRLSIGYLLENEESERPVTVADAKRWKVDAEALHGQALKNLIFRSHEHAMEVHKSDGYTMLLMAAPEKHNAVRLLLPELHSILREHLGATFYAAIPTPEFLLAFSMGSEEVLGRVRQQIAADYSRAKNGVSPRIFLVTPDGVAGDPAEEEDLDS